MIVMKFGGTSVESAAAIESVAAIVRARLARKPVVVVSAMGKTTNKLLAIAAEAVAGQSRRGARPAPRTARVSSHAKVASWSANAAAPTSKASSTACSRNSKSSSKASPSWAN